MRNAYNILVENLKRREAWIFMPIRREGGDWIHMAQHENHRQALMNTVMNLWVP
jgi:hypothetical protein